MTTDKAKAKLRMRVKEMDTKNHYSEIMEIKHMTVQEAAQYAKQVVEDTVLKKGKGKITGAVIYYDIQSADMPAANTKNTILV